MHYSVLIQYLSSLIPIDKCKTFYAFDMTNGWYGDAVTKL
jgi:hypothetical protein